MIGFTDDNRLSSPISRFNDAKIALTIPTGRPRVGEVVNSFIENAEHHGYDPSQFAVYLSIDLEYQGRSPEEFRLDSDLENRLAKVEYIFEGQRDEYGKRVVEETGVEASLADTLFIGRGYSKQRNVAIIRAAEDGNDYAICFDDDEDPRIPIQGEGNLKWAYPDFFTPHIESLSNGADITRGPCLGYLSPIPSDFEQSIPADVRRRLGKALSIGSEVIDESSFFGLMSKIGYLPAEELESPSRPFIVDQGKYGKNILTGNMGVNLDSVRSGKVPIFYTPPGARGEDAIFALQLRDLVVSEVSSYIFHDPFVMYPEISKGVVPNRLANIGVDADTKKRFAGAVDGWLKYAPMLIAMTSQDPVEIEGRIGDMIAKIGDPTKRLADLLSYPALKNSKSTLVKYSSELPVHMGELEQVQSLWRNKIAPNLETRAIRY